MNGISIPIVLISVVLVSVVSSLFESCFVLARKTFYVVQLVEGRSLLMSKKLWVQIPDMSYIYNLLKIKICKGEFIVFYIATKISADFMLTPLLKALITKN